MDFSDDDNNNVPLAKFESMLKTNNVLFFDSEEFENKEGKQSLFVELLSIVTQIMLALGPTVLANDSILLLLI